MKFPLTVAVLSCAFLSLAYANENATEQSLTQLEDEPHNVDQQVTVAEEPFTVSSPEVAKVLMQIPELVQAVADKQIRGNGLEEGLNSTEVIDTLEMASPANNRVPKQLIGFIPTYLLRQAIRMAEEQQSDDFRALRYVSVEDDDDDTSDEIEEERAIRRRKRFRRRNSKGHLKKSRRQKNTNKRNLKTRRKANSKIKTQNRRGYTQRKTSPKKTKTKKKTTKRKPNQRRGN